MVGVKSRGKSGIKSRVKSRSKKTQKWEPLKQPEVPTIFNCRSLQIEAKPTQREREREKMKEEVRKEPSKNVLVE